MSEQVKRYKFGPNFYSAIAACGREFVLASDYATLQAECERLRDKWSDAEPAGDDVRGRIVAAYGAGKWLAEFDALLAERDTLRAELAAIKAQEPVGGRSRFIGQGAWARCSVEHVTLVLSAPHEWPDYEVQHLYALPAATPQLTTTGNDS